MRKCSLGLTFAALLGATPILASAPTVQGFVSAELLVSWCRSEAALDREGCLSYLRGVFDALRAVELTHPVSGVPNQSSAACIPPEAPITLLRIASLRHADSFPPEVGQQGAMFLGEAWASAFPCDEAAQ